MVPWELLVIFGILFLVIEIFMPMVFFLNFAIACFLTAILALFIVSWNFLIPICVILSAVFLLFLRPILVKSRNGDKKTGVEEKYIGKTAKVVETVTSKSGVVSIYDERWNARSADGSEIPAGVEVKIVRNESLMLFVEKVNL